MPGTVDLLQLRAEPSKNFDMRTRVQRLARFGSVHRDRALRLHERAIARKRNRKPYQPRIVIEGSQRWHHQPNERGPRTQEERENSPPVYPV